jgi:mannitol/fructose-specific phosphotransferase system IIA component (Ntr-type)
MVRLYLPKQRQILLRKKYSSFTSHGRARSGEDVVREILDRVLRREADLSTAVFPGAAIPHGKARSVDRMAAACGLAPEGVAFDSMDGE